MMKLSTLVFVPFAFSIAACGGSSGPGGNNNGPIDDKESAAGAAYRVQNTNDDVHGRGGRGLSPAQVPDLPGVPGTGGEVKFTVQGQSGSAEITEKSVIGMEGIMAEFTVKYLGYSGDGVNTLDGEVTQTAHVSAVGGNAEISTSVRGTLDITGELDSHLVMDVSTGVSASGTTASVTIDGSITADGATYEYNGEQFSFTRVGF